MSLSSPPLPASNAPPSPPTTPSNPSRESPNHSDDSIEDLSFEYVFDNQGNWVRLSKGSSSKSNGSSPPTPQDSLPDKSPPVARRASLSRSESARIPSTTSTTATIAETNDRKFKRVASGPVLSKARPIARRVTSEDSGSKHRSTAASSRPSYQHEKENLLTSDSEHDIPKSAPRHPATRSAYSRPLLTDAHQRQILPGPNRAGRVMKSVSASSSSTSAPVQFGLAIDRIPESVDDTPPPDYSETDLGMLPFISVIALLMRSFVSRRRSSTPLFDAFSIRRRHTSL